MNNLNKLIYVLALGLLAGAAGANECRPAQGQKIFANKCGICHVAIAGEGHTVGPNLHGVLGRGIGRADGFVYSEALGSANVAWDTARLDAFIKAPQQAMPGSAMPFLGLKSEAERQQLICFLQDLK